MGRPSSESILMALIPCFTWLQVPNMIINNFCILCCKRRLRMLAISRQSTPKTFYIPMEWFLTFSLAGKPGVLSRCSSGWNKPAAAAIGTVLELLYFQSIVQLLIVLKSSLRCELINRQGSPVGNRPAPAVIMQGNTLLKFQLLTGWTF